MEPLAHEAGLSVRVESKTSIKEFFFDRDKIIQILINLIGNAIKFTQTGSLTISSHTDDSKASICVTDTGPGIAQEDIPKVFQSFQQLNEGRKKGGIGLGLAISKELIELHSGSIKIESELGGGQEQKYLLKYLCCLHPKTQKGGRDDEKNSGLQNQK